MCIARQRSALNTMIKGWAVFWTLALRGVCVKGGYLHMCSVGLLWVFILWKVDREERGKMKGEDCIWESGNRSRKRGGKADKGPYLFQALLCSPPAKPPGCTSVVSFLCLTTLWYYFHSSPSGVRGNSIRPPAPTLWPYTSIQLPDFYMCTAREV